MYLFYGVRLDNDKFCHMFGPAVLSISSDEVLNQAIRVILNREYIIKILTNKRGEAYTQRSYLNEYIWPSDFKHRVINISSQFFQDYGLEIIFPGAQFNLIVGQRLTLVQPIYINEVQQQFSWGSDINSLLKSSSNNMVNSGHIFLIPEL